MAFDTAGLRRYAYGGRVLTKTYSLWHYATPDTAATVEAANYFNSATSQLRKGDLIEAVMVTGGTPVTKRYVVTSADDAATVTVALQVTTAG
jgi:hypothetical protein